MKRQGDEGGGSGWKMKNSINCAIINKFYFDVMTEDSTTVTEN